MKRIYISPSIYVKKIRIQSILDGSREGTSPTIDNTTPADVTPGSDGTISQDAKQGGGFDWGTPENE